MKEHYCCDNRDALILMNVNLNNYSMETTFTKSDLKPGMIVQLNDGTYRIILESNIGPVLCHNRSCKRSLRLDFYNKNLKCDNKNYTYEENKRYDIVKVFIARCDAIIEGYLEGSYLTPIWVRENVVNITTEDLKRFKKNESSIIKLILDNGDVITIE